MELTENIKEFIDGIIRPQSWVDGGDLKFESYVEDTVVIGAYGECSVCICCHDRMKTWLKGQLKKQFGIDVDIKFNKYVPYFKR